MSSSRGRASSIRAGVTAAVMRRIADAGIGSVDQADVEAGRAVGAAAGSTRSTSAQRREAASGRPRGSSGSKRIVRGS